MIEIKHYGVELEVTDRTIEYFSTTLKYDIEKFELGDIKKIIVTLPKRDLVSMVECEFGEKSLKWFEGLYKKLEKTIIKLHAL